MANVYGVVLAGGMGARFWPLSRERRPKQTLNLFGSESQIQSTLYRLQTLIDKENIFIVTNALQKPIIQQQLNDFPERNIIGEPLSRNTGPCIGLAAMHIRQIDPDGVMVIVPSDHLIQDIDQFKTILQNAITVADKSNSLVTIGIEPTRPETGYGYIQLKEENEKDNPYITYGAYRVKTFAEKPNLPTAERFLDSGDFLWNSGMFIWRVDVILNEIKRHLPDLYEALETIARSIGSGEYLVTIEQAYRMIRGISIDYGVMEKTKNVFVLRGKFGWSDLGSWDEVYRVSSKDENNNAIHGNVIVRNSKNNLLFSTSRHIATHGVEDLIIVETEDAILICKRSGSQDVKEIVDYMRRKHLDELL